MRRARHDIEIDKRLTGYDGTYVKDTHADLQNWVDQLINEANQLFFRKPVRNQFPKQTIPKGTIAYHTTEGAGYNIATKFFDGDYNK